jgi:polyhydroxybutyrate depolymerase
VAVRAFVAGLAVVVATGACSRSGSKSPDAGSIVASRPYGFKVPTGYDSKTPTPLVILLHGYGASGVGQESYFQLGAVADAQTFLYAFPDGTADATGRRFWNADDACCDFFGSGVDDVAYLNAMIDDISSKYTVDPKRIFVVGHSNGAFMSHRLACDLSNRIAAIAALAGAVWNDASKCNPTSPVSVLDIHGDADLVVNYAGGSLAVGLVAPGAPSKTPPPYPSEAQTMATWAAKNRCTGALAADGVVLDLDTLVAGSETSERAYAGCPSGLDVELWTITGGSHVPVLAQPTWGEAVYGFLKKHPKP